MQTAINSQNFALHGLVSALSCLDRTLPPRVETPIDNPRATLNSHGAMVPYPFPTKMTRKKGGAAIARLAVASADGA